jgi:hypothetical protein
MPEKPDASGDQRECQGLKDDTACGAAVERPRSFLRGLVVFQYGLTILVAGKTAMGAKQALNI